MIHLGIDWYISVTIVTQGLCLNEDLLSLTANIMLACDCIKLLDNSVLESGGMSLLLVFFSELDITASILSFDIDISWGWSSL
jgi:hypothetical protein